MTPEIRLLIGKGLIRGENFSGGAKMIEMALEELSESERALSDAEKTRLRLMVADAFSKGNNKSAAWETLEKIEKHNDRALLMMAKLQLNSYKDEEQATPIFQKLIDSPDTSPEILAESYIHLGSILFGNHNEPAKCVDFLKKAAEKIPGEYAYELYCEIGENLSGLNNHGQAVNWWEKAASTAPSGEEMASCSVKAVNAMLKSKQWQRARLKLNTLLSSGLPASHQKEVKQMLLETAAKQQLASLRKGLNWDDPESNKNLEILKKMAKLYISPLGEMEQARAVITQATEIFSGADNSHDVKEILATIPVMTQIQKLHTIAKTPEDYYELARLCEYNANDPVQAAEYYKTVAEQWPEHRLTPSRIDVSGENRVSHSGENSGFTGTP